MAQASMRDQPGTLREYETIFILRPDTQNESIAQVNARIRGVIEGAGGKLLKLDNWGKRKLAYEIKKELKGIYLYWQYLGSSGLVGELERNLRMLDSVIRYYTTIVDADIDPSARPSDLTDETFAAAATTGPDEEEIMTGAAAARGFGDDDDDFGEFDPAAEEAKLRRAAAEEPAVTAEADTSAEGAKKPE
jgi:small subunit ribosomal protein S6